MVQTFCYTSKEVLKNFFGIIFDYRVFINGMSFL